MAKGQSESEGLDSHHMLLVPNEAWQRLVEKAEFRRMSVQDYVAWLLSFGIEREEEIDLYIYEKAHH